MAERKYFFVSQGKTYIQESSGKYLWAPDDSCWHHQTMKEINAGDVILNYTNQSIAAISIARGSAKKSIKPSEYGNSTVWQKEGLKVEVDIYQFPQALAKSFFIDFFYEKQNGFHGIVNASKGINQIYLGKINQQMVEKVLQESEKNPANKEVIRKIKELISLPQTNSTLVNFGEFKGIIDMSETKQKIEQIKNYISSKGFTYEGNLIENFYLSLKSKPFVILAGTSGTGKTRLAKLFAEAIEATEENGQFKLVPVRPDWSDSSDLFGHINLDNKFVPGAILDFIKTASENLEKPYFLCLDEMNLARVEYYMSDFLSVIETRDFNSDKTVIKTSPLMSLDKYGVDEDAKQKYGTLGLPENLYIIGTVNMDETTFQFSKKVLDRANTIEFSLVDLMPKFSNSSVENQQPIEEKNNFLKSKYLKINECAAEAEFVEEGCSKLIKINDVLEKASLHIGYRVRDEIMFYMLNNKEAGNLISDDEAFDNEIMQKILPRIQGSSQSIKDLLCELFKIFAGDFTGIQTENNSASEQMQVFIDSESCIYSKSAKKIQFMTRRFEEDGFTSFWL